MKKTLLMTGMIVCSLLSYSQNLVPNPGFENPGNIDCGIYVSSNFTQSITSWTVAGGTPDLYSTQIDQACFNFQTNSTYAGPIGLKGPQAPHGGRIFAGIFGYTLA